MRIRQGQPAMRRIFISTILLISLLGQIGAVEPFSLSTGKNQCNCGCAGTEGECCCHKIFGSKNSQGLSWAAELKCGNNCQGNFARVFRDNQAPITSRLPRQIPTAFQGFYISSAVPDYSQGGYLRFLYQRPPPEIV